MNYETHMTSNGHEFAHTLERFTWHQKSLDPFDNEDVLMARSKKVRWVSDARSFALIMHGGEVVSKLNEYHDCNLYGSSIKSAIEEAKDITEKFNVTCSSSMSIEVKVKLSNTAVLDKVTDQNTKNEYPNCTYFGAKIHALFPTVNFDRKTIDNGVIHTLLPLPVWSSKLSNEQNENDLERVLNKINDDSFIESLILA